MAEQLNETILDFDSERKIYTVTFRLTKEVVKSGMVDNLRSWFEIEILRGSTRHLPNGLFELCFELDEARGNAMRRSLATVVFKVNENLN